MRACHGSGATRHMKLLTSSRPFLTVDLRAVCTRGQLRVRLFLVCSLAASRQFARRAQMCRPSRFILYDRSYNRRLAQHIRERLVERSLQAESTQLAGTSVCDAALRRADLACQASGCQTMHVHRIRQSACCCQTACCQWRADRQPTGCNNVKPALCRCTSPALRMQRCLHMTLLWAACRLSTAVGSLQAV